MRLVAGCGLASYSSTYAPSQVNGWVNGYHQKHAVTGGLGHQFFIGVDADLLVNGR